MKRKYLSLFILLFTILSCSENKSEQDKYNNLISTELVNNPATASNDSDNSDSPKPEITFEKDVFDFGKIIQGEKVSYSFKFKNSGNADLVITSATASCGCTVPKWSKEPIHPGSDGTIEVTYDSHGKQGMQSKSVTLVANTIPNRIVLNIKGEVVTEQEKK